MRITVEYGRQAIELDVPEDRVVGRHQKPTSLTDLGSAVCAALEEPYHFPPLRRALTPDDQVAVVVDEDLPQIGELLTLVLDHIVQAGVQAQALTLLCPPSRSGQPWVDDLPEHLEEVQVEVHDPTDSGGLTGGRCGGQASTIQQGSKRMFEARPPQPPPVRSRLSYLATTKQGRRIYLNRTLVDADQVVVLTGRRYDPLLGYGGAEGAIYPALADEETRTQISRQASLELPGTGSWPVQQEAAEVAWLLGVPFFVQVIESTGEGIAHVLGGSIEASASGVERLNATWRQSVPHPVDLVVTGLSGDPSRHTFADLARALSVCARVVRSGGKIVLLTQAQPALDVELSLLGAHAQNSDGGWLKRLRRDTTVEGIPLLHWANAIQDTHIYLLSAMDPEIVENLSITPLEDVRQVQRLVDSSASCLVLPDAHKALAVLE